MAPSVFKDCGDHVVYRDPDLDRLATALLDLGRAQSGDRRWGEIELVVRGHTFYATFTYSEETGPEDEGEKDDHRPFARRDRIVAKYFGDKPIVYPPMPDT